MKVEFTARGGWNYEREEAQKSLVIGLEYEVECVIIDKWRTYLKLKNGNTYNHCLFSKNEVLEEVIRTGKYDGSDFNVSVRC